MPSRGCRSRRARAVCHFGAPFPEKFSLFSRLIHTPASFYLFYAIDHRLSSFAIHFQLVYTKISRYFYSRAQQVCRLWIYASIRKKRIICYDIYPCSFKSAREKRRVARGEIKALQQVTRGVHQSCAAGRSKKSLLAGSFAFFSFSIVI